MSPWINCLSPKWYQTPYETKLAKKYPLTTCTLYSEVYCASGYIVKVSRNRSWIRSFEIRSALQRNRATSNQMSKDRSFFEPISKIIKGTDPTSKQFLKDRTNFEPK